MKKYLFVTILTLFLVACNTDVGEEMENVNTDTIEGIIAEKSTFENNTQMLTVVPNIIASEIERVDD